VFGLGLVSLKAGTSGHPGALAAVPAWVGVTWGGATSCPAISVATSTTTPPPDAGQGYTAVVIGADNPSTAFVYQDGGATCGAPSTAPTIQPATVDISVPWELVAGNPSVVDYQAPACASELGATSQSSGDWGTLTVDVSEPWNEVGCGPVITQQTQMPIVPRPSFPSPTPPPPGTPSTLPSAALRHGPLGPVATLQVMAP
jgi:hypothetical protein